MQKKLKSYTVVASIFASLALIFVACGKGELTEYLEVDLNGSKESLWGKCLDPEKGAHISECIGNIDSTLSSSSIPPPSSEAPISSAAPPPPPPSSGGGGTSSAAPPPPPPPSSGGGTSSAAPPPPPPPPSSSSAPPPVGGACPSGTAKPGYDCSWDFKETATHKLTPGTRIKPEKTGDDAGCTTKWLYKTGTSPLLKCSETTSEGLISEGSRAYILYATLDCGDKSYVNNCKPTDGLSSKDAPELTGDCVWDKNPPEVNTGRGAKPSGVSIIDKDNICGSTKSVVYKYKAADGSLKDWPSTGILSDWKNWGKKDSAIYEVEAVLNCPAYTIPVSSTCPKLKVRAGVEYVIECKGGENLSDDCAKKSVTLKLDECVELTVLGYTNQYNLPDKVVTRCNLATGGQPPFTIELNGKAQTFTNHNGEITLGKLKLGDNEFGTLCMKSDKSVVCSGPSQ